MIYGRVNRIHRVVNAHTGGQRRTGSDEAGFVVEREDKSHLWETHRCLNLLL